MAWFCRGEGELFFLATALCRPSLKPLDQAAITYPELWFDGNILEVLYWMWNRRWTKCKPHYWWPITSCPNTSKCCRPGKLNVKCRSELELLIGNRYSMASFSIFRYRISICLDNNRWLFNYLFPTRRLELSIVIDKSMGYFLLFLYWRLICHFFLTVDFQPWCRS